MAGREEEGTEGCCEWKEQYHTTAFNSGKAVRAAGSQTEGPPAAPSADSAHCFSPLFPEDVGQALLPKR